ALLDLEEATLELVGLPSARPPALAAPSLNGELHGLTRELVRTRQEMTTSARQLAGLDLAQLAHLGELTDLGQLAHLSELADLAPLLRSLDQRLSQIHAELSRDLVLTRLTPARNQGLAR